MPKVQVGLTLSQIKKEICVGVGNSKLGKSIVTFSKLAGSHESCSCVDTSNCEKYCYALRYCKRYPNVKRGYAKNSNLLRKKPSRFFNLVATYMHDMDTRNKPVGEVRINVSGEFSSVKEIIAWNDIALMNPSTLFYAYTKNYLALETFYMLKNVKHAGNFIINISEWKNHEVTEELAKKTGCSVFACVEKEDREKYRQMGYVFCPSYDDKGHRRKEITCDHCSLCKKRGLHVACYEH